MKLASKFGFYFDRISTYTHDNGSGFKKGHVASMSL